MNNYGGHMGYNQPYPPATGQFPPPGAGYPPAPASSMYPQANPPAPSIGFAPPPGPGYPPAGPGYAPAGPGYPPAGPGPTYFPQVFSFVLLLILMIQYCAQKLIDIYSL